MDQIEVDLFEDSRRIVSSGPLTAALAARREALIEDFVARNPFDDDTHGISRIFAQADAAERACIVPLWSAWMVPEVFSTCPTLDVTPEIDTLSIMRSARDEGYTSPLLASYESAALAAGRA
jgi:hypothetical protein